MRIVISILAGLLLVAGCSTPAAQEGLSIDVSDVDLDERGLRLYLSITNGESYAVLVERQDLEWLKFHGEREDSAAWETAIKPLTTADKVVEALELKPGQTFSYDLMVPWRWIDEPYSGRFRLVFDIRDASTGVELQKELRASEPFALEYLDVTERDSLSGGGSVMMVGFWSEFRFLDSSSERLLGVRNQKV